MTVDWHNPARVLAEYSAFIKFIHVLGGVYIWEFVLNLGFEYSIITGKRKLTRSFPLYLGCRLSFLLYVAVQFLQFDTSHKINCQGLVVMIFIFGYSTLMFASALIALRVTALWEHNRIIVAVAFTSWLANTIIYVYTTVKSRGYWTGSECVIQNTSHSRIGVFSTLALDLLLLTLMLVGLLRWKGALQGGGIFQLLYVQGLTWVLVVTLAEIPPAVFTALNLNDPMNVMFQALGLIIMSLGATRMYRGLVVSPFSNNPPFETAAVGNRLTEPHHVSFGPSHQNFLGEGTHGVGGTVECADVQSPCAP